MESLKSIKGKTLPKEKIYNIIQKFGNKITMYQELDDCIIIDLIDDTFIIVYKEEITA